MSDPSNRCQGSFPGDTDTYGTSARVHPGRRGCLFTGGRPLPPALRLRSLAPALALLVIVPGCVRRTLSISTEPPGALVFLNDQEVGRSTVTTDFLWYGDYDVIIRKKGYQTLQTHWEIKPPWYQRIPIDFFAEVLWPGRIHDRHERNFVLETAVPPTQEELISRAVETQKRALERRK